MTSRVAVFAALLALCSHAAASEANLDRWFEGELLPFVKQRLALHPRFKGETLMFVVFDDNAPAAVSNALALSLRDRMLAAAVHNGGIRVAWKQGNTGRSVKDRSFKQRPLEDRASDMPVDCSRDDVHYYVGLDVSRRFNGDFEFSVRALDLEDRSWVSGFAKTWRGKLDRAQMQAMRQTEVDETFLGARDVPFTLAQTDLLAEHLAHQLSCELLRQSGGEYRVPTSAAATGDDEAANDNLDAAIELIGKNITAQSTFAVTPDENQANAELSGKAHRIDGPLHQYWLSITPNGRDSDLSVLSASAYVVLPNTQQADTRRPVAVPRAQHDSSLSASRRGSKQPGTSLAVARSGALIGPLRVVHPRDARQCGARDAFVRTGAWHDKRHCSLLETDAYGDTVVFFLEYQPQLGLVRLDDGDCQRRTRARVVRGGESLRFPIARLPTDTGSLRKADEWRIEPAADTYYAIALSDARSARRMANHIDRLPARCGEPSRPGLKNAKLRDWLDEFSLLAAQSANVFDWRALERKDVY